MIRAREGEALSLHEDSTCTRYPCVRITKYAGPFSFPATAVFLVNNAKWSHHPTQAAVRARRPVGSSRGLGQVDDDYDAASAKSAQRKCSPIPDHFIDKRRVLHFGGLAAGVAAATEGTPEQNTTTAPNSNMLTDAQTPIRHSSCLPITVVSGHDVV
jgi:hypothetical protein